MEATELQKLKKQIDELTDGVKEIKKAILGDEFNPIGYKERLKDIEMRLENVEDFITKWKWIIVGAIAFAGYGGVTFVETVIELINHTKK